METNENILLSVKDHVIARLQAMGYTTVYTEKNMRDIAKGILVLPANKSYIFVVDTFTKPTETTLPFIVIELQPIDREPFELGNDGNARQFTTYIHVFGRSRSERNQIASYLQGSNGIGRSITYYDYTGVAAVEQAYPIQRVSGIRVDNAPPVRDEQIQEYSLANWNIVSFDAMTTL
jgi:hypothetical protein